MSVKGRLTAMEAAPSPLAALLRWIVLAHAYGSLQGYVMWQVGRSARVPDHVILVRALTEAGHKAHRDAGGRTPSTEMRRALGDAYLGFELVLQVNAIVDEVVRLDQLRIRALRHQLRAIAGDERLGNSSGTPGLPGGASSILEEWHDWQAAARDILRRLYAFEAARVLLETTMLDGQPVLFPDLASDNADTIWHAESLVAGKWPNPAIKSSSDRPPPDTALAEIRGQAAALAPEWAAALLDTARRAALDLIGDPREALTIIPRAAWLTG